ncbi:MAG TPA: hypothetical protein VMU94_30365 [Streptosporangiaceae bacterium]|nr:hypothetical protein [Streptosporangiaceae bacterium]
MIDGTDPVLGTDGVTMTTGTYTPTEVCDQGLADKLGIPAQYLRRMREQRPAMYDANVNGWLDGDPRKFLVRCLRPSIGIGPGAARAFLRVQADRQPRRPPRSTGRRPGRRGAGGRRRLRPDRAADVRPRSVARWTRQPDQS